MKVFIGLVDQSRGIIQDKNRVFTLPIEYLLNK